MRALIFAAALLLFQTAGASAQQPPIAIPNPNYTVLHFEMNVADPAQDVWARVGSFCAIAKWWPATCSIISGKENELGATRLVNTGAVEILVAKTDLSYTYTQPARVGAPYNLYHGTLEVKPVSPTASKLVYSLIYDVSMLPDDAARAAEMTNRKTRFQQVMQNLKAVAEGGTVPAPAGRRGQ
jgi:hypothetical protein